MIVNELGLPGLKLITMKPHGDARGFFVERFHRDRFRELGIPADEFMQDNYSRSAMNVLRGLHYQYDRPQGKLVTATAGRIFDVVVDIRKDSSTFGKSVGVDVTFRESEPDLL